MVNRFPLDSLVHSTLGFERIFDDVQRLIDGDVQKTVSSFPPHNIIKLDENRYVFELAIAGFSKDEIEITFEKNVLTVKGEKKEKTEPKLYLHHGIGTRSFTKKLTLADTIEIRGAEFKDGILRIGVENVVPENKKPRKIEIGEELKSFSPQLLTEQSA